MSHLSENVAQLLDECFPKYTRISEYYVSYNQTQLYFDFLIRELNLLVEVQGIQHYQYTPFFQKDPYYFHQQKWRDSLKKEWADLNGFTLIEVNDKTDLTKENLMKIVMDALS